jgi:hypothetical protein
MPGIQKRDDKAGSAAQRDWLLANWKKLGDALRPHLNALDLPALAIDPEEVEEP